jgi:hypothetical protein
MYRILVEPGAQAGWLVVKVVGCWWFVGLGNDSLGSGKRIAVVLNNTAWNLFDIFLRYKSIL